MESVMKYFLYAFLLIQSMAAAMEEPSTMNWKTLTLHITDIDIKRPGEIVVMVFQEDGFPKDHEKAIRKYHIDPLEPHHQLSIQVPDGKFALKIHHDEDRSGTMTKNWTGFIPAEGVGFSSGAKVKFGPPSFKVAQMQLPDSGEASIAIIYP
ncbi:MAG TPA: hypothetical protein DIW64_00700 [Cellvibrio sp.]|nr:hypothetical protein [Cellvibrio sp.]